MLAQQDHIASKQKLQRAIGQICLSVNPCNIQGSKIADLREQGSLRAVFPRPICPEVTAVILNTAGGVAAGDAFSVTAEATQNTRLTITTQAAERIYGAPDQAVGRIKTQLRVHENACLNWLPQETILFDGARLKRTLDVDVAKGATFLMVEPIVFGRAASGETVCSGLFRDKIRITSDDRPIYFDAIQMSDDMEASLHTQAIANGHHAIASVVFVSPRASEYLTQIRNALPATAGASLITETLLAIRVLAEDSFALRQALLPVLETLTDNAVPKNWKL